MNAYYRSRDGQVDGPYFEGQLIAMRTAGGLLSTDLLCLQGDEDWLPAEVVMDGVAVAPASAPRPEPEKIRTAKKKRKSSGRGVAVLLFLLGIGVLVFLSWLAGALMILVSLLLDQVFWICSGCGNKVARTSKQCPVCRAVLGR